MEEIEKRLSCKEVADIYGVKEITVWQWIREKKLPAVRMNKGYVIRPEDLRHFERGRMTVSDRRDA